MSEQKLNSNKVALPKAPGELEKRPPREITYGSAVGLSGNMIKVDYERFSEDVGVTDHNLMRGIASQIEALGSVGQEMKEENIKFIYSILVQSGVSDAFGVMLAVQMAACHLLSVRYAGRAGRARSPEEIESAERAMSRVMRTYALQMTAMGNHRTGPCTQVTVGSVTVEGGGQAVVGNVVKGKR